MNKTLFLAMQDEEIANRLTKIARQHTRLQLDLLKNRFTLSDETKRMIEKKIRLLKMERDYILTMFEQHGQDSINQNFKKEECQMKTLTDVRKVWVAYWQREDEKGEVHNFWMVTDDEEFARIHDPNYQLATVEEVNEYLKSGDHYFGDLIETVDGVAKWVNTVPDNWMELDEWDKDWVMVYRLIKKSQ